MNKVEMIENPPVSIFEGKKLDDSIEQIYLHDGKAVAFAQRGKDKVYFYFVHDLELYLYEMRQESIREVDESMSNVLKRDGILFERDGEVSGMLDRNGKRFYYFNDDIRVCDLVNPRMFTWDKEMVAILQVILEKDVE